MIDKSTWAGEDYEPLVNGIWQDIMPHAHHQQRCENYVQMAALIAKTLVKEARRTWRAIAVSTIIRRFNIQAVERKRKTEADPAKRNKITRVEGRYRIEYFSDFVGNFRKEVGRARNQTSDERYKEIVASIAKTDNKVSADEEKAFLSEFERAVKKPTKEYQAELESGYEQTAQMGGRVVLSFLSKANDVRIQFPLSRT